MDYVLKHYYGYIVELAKRPILNDMGYLEMDVDCEMKNRLEAKLISKILFFNMHNLK